MRRQEKHAAYNEKFAKFGEHYEQCLIHEQPTIPEMKAAWNVTERLLLSMRGQVREHGAEFWIPVLTTEFHVSADQAVRQAHMKLCGVDTLFYPDDRLEAFGERNAIPVMALGPVLSAYADRNKVYLHGFANTRLATGHLDETGHLLTGSLIAARICAAHGVRTAPIETSFAKHPPSD